MSEHEYRNPVSHVLLAVADKADATATATALEPCQPDHVPAVQAVEKGNSVPDKTTVEQSYAAVRTVFPEADTHAAYIRDAIKGILAVVEEVDTSAVAHRARSGNRITQFLSGDRSVKPVTQTDRPVIALPRAESDDE